MTCNASSLNTMRTLFPAHITIQGRCFYSSGSFCPCDDLGTQDPTALSQCHLLGFWTPLLLASGRRRGSVPGPECILRNIREGSSHPCPVCVSPALRSPPFPPSLNERPSLRAPLALCLSVQSHPLGCNFVGRATASAVCKFQKNFAPGIQEGFNKYWLEEFNSKIQNPAACLHMVDMD